MQQGMVVSFRIVHYSIGLLRYCSVQDILFVEHKQAVNCCSVFLLTLGSYPYMGCVMYAGGWRLHERLAVPRLPELTSLHSSDYRRSFASL